ncbi:25.4 kDa [Spodoptera frugiperda ascovirus 1a]|uniref:25.4 kDa n=1 Tax=Spodoptera frugiperda ascovirus 1a TaxID=113370 RepID=Q0E523_SFAVA|nr:25.4 kDa [Spodoptera frugiperda ascovirus 1a]CAL44678.1 25.4 kDa [Spodoptera frugiperda ascovirus 1a]
MILFVTCLFVTTVYGDCSTTTLSFVRKTGNCFDYEQGSVSHPTSYTSDPYRINYFADTVLPFCEVDVCADGRHHLFCTVDNTSDGECLTGDPVQNFKNIHGPDKVGSVAVKIDDIHIIPALVKTFKHLWTSKERSINVYEHNYRKGASLSIETTVGECVNLPLEWRDRVSSYGSMHQARFYTGLDCTGHNVVACHDFVEHPMENLWGLLCQTDGMNDNTKSLKFDK